MTQMKQAKRGRITDEMRYVAAVEGTDPESLRARIAAGVAIIPKNVHHDFNPIGVGRGLSTKVNANIGTSGHHQQLHEEVEKLRVAVACGAEMIMDLSTGDELDLVRREILRRCPVILGTVPIYQAVADRGSVYDMTLSLGDGIRPGATGDATDAAQIQELLTLGELTRRARARAVQVMIEGPGHVPINQIEANVQIEKRVCGGAPFYVLGPLTSDIGAGYDHITGAVGGAAAAAAGADVLCYLTPAEHLRLPTIPDVRDGVIATKIAAHSGDLAKSVFGAKERDDQMSVYRKRLDWEGQYRLALDPERAREIRRMSEDYDKAVCTMCGTLCSMALENTRSRLGELLTAPEEEATHRHVRVGSAAYRRTGNA